MQANNAHTGKLKQRLEDRTGDNPDNEKEIQVIGEVSKKLAQLTQEVIKYLSAAREMP